jgi:hypothetical protein
MIDDLEDFEEELPSYGRIRKLLVTALGIVGVVLAVFVVLIFLSVREIHAAPTGAELRSVASDDIQDSAASPDRQFVIVRLKSACVHPAMKAPMVETVKPEYRNQFKAGVGVVRGRKPYSLCWFASGGVVFVVWEDKSMTPVPESLFMTPSQRERVGVEV